MNATEFNEILNAACGQALVEGVNKKQLKITEMVGILEIHQQNLIGLHMQRQFAPAQIQKAATTVLTGPHPDK